MTEKTYKEHDIPIYSIKGLRKFKDIKSKIYNLLETSTTSVMVEKVCNIVLFLIAADRFTPINASKAFCIWLLRIVVQIL